MGNLHKTLLPWSQPGSPAAERLLKKFEVKGVPTIVLLNRKGLERHDLRKVICRHLGLSEPEPRKKAIF